ncbi:MAG: flagellar FlbD family protein [Moorella sp. (in: Bacteria)]|nr:flagellar FlbD family protein [Moorella sp. (in: firmicutes)]
MGVIKVTTLDRREIVLNAELIERIESVPETVITLTSGKKVLVTQPVEEIVNRVVAYRRLIHMPTDSQDGVK